MQPRLWLLVFVVALTADAGSAFAHHAFSNTYLVDREIAIEGRVVGVVYRNPHSYIHLMAPDGSKHLRVWAVECSNRGELSQRGVFAETLKPGDHLVVTGSPGRDADAWRLRMRTIVRPSDGWRWRATGQ